MTTSSVSVQKALHAKLVNNAALVALVSPSAIFDRTTKPEEFPCVIIGDGQAIFHKLAYGKRVTTQHFDVHAWVLGEALLDVKAIADAVAVALADGIGSTADFREVAGTVIGCRVMRDPGGRCVHAIISFQTLVEEVL